MLLGITCGLLVYHTHLQPQHLRPGGDCVVGDGQHLLAAPKYVHDVYTVRYLLDGGVGLLAQDRPRKVGVDREDLVPKIL